VDWIGLRTGCWG